MATRMIVAQSAGIASVSSTDDIVPVVRRRRHHQPEDRYLTALTRIGIGVFAVQFAILTAISWMVFQTFTVGIDFGIFSQALSQIAAGNISPVSTLSDTSYISSHFELMMWPMSILHRLFGTSFVLLVLQAAGLAMTGWVTLSWVVATARTADTSTVWRRAVATTALVLLAINPIAYLTAAQDFHFWAICACLVVLTARDLCAGRTSRMWLWVVLCLLCGDVGATFVFGVGISALLAGPRTRRWAPSILGAGLLWVMLVSATGNNNASHVAEGYGYLADVPKLDDGARGFVQLIQGVVSDPVTPAQTLGERWSAIIHYVAAGGGIGIFSPWGIGVPLVAILIAGLQQSSIFINQPFQNFAVTPFVTFGTAWVALWLARTSRPQVTRVFAGAVLAFAVVTAAMNAWVLFPDTFTKNGIGGLVPATQAQALQTALQQIPPDAQVIASTPVIGRFAEHEFVYPLRRGVTGGANEIPIRAGRVAVVIDRVHALQLLSTTEQDSLLAQLSASGSYELLVDRDGVIAVLWTPPPGQTTLKVGASS